MAQDIKKVGVFFPELLSSAYQYVQSSSKNGSTAATFVFHGALRWAVKACTSIEVDEKWSIIIFYHEFKIKSNVVRTTQVHKDTSFSRMSEHILKKKRWYRLNTWGSWCKHGFRFVYTHTQEPIKMQYSTIWYLSERNRKKNYVQCSSDDFVWHSLAPVHTIPILSNLWRSHDSVHALKSLSLSICFLMELQNI